MMLDVGHPSNEQFTKLISKNGRAVLIIKNVLSKVDILKEN
jgi:predicted RNA-binding protein YlqC (UPF0109 family)